MNHTEKKKFNQFYEQHLLALKLQGNSKKTIDAYSRSVRRVAKYFDCCPDELTQKQLKLYFAALVDSHSWSTVKVDRNGLMFFWKHVLHREWDWIKILKPPQVKTLPDILTLHEVHQVLSSLRKRRFKACLFTIYSLGLRLGEGISLKVADIDSQRSLVHIRGAKGLGVPDKRIALFLFLLTPWIFYLDTGALIEILPFFFPVPSAQHSASKPLKKVGIVPECKAR